MELRAYCDVDYAGDGDLRRSTMGFVFVMHGGAMSWSSRLQPTVAASIVEAHRGGGGNEEGVQKAGGRHRTRHWRAPYLLRQ
jgi:hypothetical protein